MIDEYAVITHSDPKSPISEAYRMLRTNIQYSSFDKPLKTFAITSSGPMEGKTTTAVNLAVTFANAGSRVLLVDADLRKPQIHKMLVLSNRSGLTGYMALHDDLNNYVRSCDIGNLSVLTSGIIPPNPSELLVSDSMKQFMTHVKKEYDIVIFDTPPVGHVTDAAIISALVDGVILVINSGKVKIDDAKRAKEMLVNVNANILGVVLNNLHKGVKGNYQYYRYINEENKEKKKGKRRKEKELLP